MKKYWIGIASADHVARGQLGGFMQVCHGKAAPLRRISPSDGVVYYSPTQVFRATDSLQSFTAIGFTKDHLPYLVDMGQGFTPYRRDVDWAASNPTPIRPLLDNLDLTRGVRNWGYSFRFGLLGISCADFNTIAVAMNADVCLPVESAANSP